MHITIVILKILHLVELVLIHSNIAVNSNGKSFVLCASWAIYSGYQRKIWTIRGGASARMPLHAMVLRETTCWSSLSSTTTIGSSVW